MSQLTLWEWGGFLHCKCTTCNFWVAGLPYHCSMCCPILQRLFCRGQTDLKTGNRQSLPKKHCSLQDVFNFTLEQTLQPPGCFGFYPWTSKNNATLWVWYTIGSNQLWGTISWESHPSPHSAAGSVSSNGLASRRLIGSSLGAIHWLKVHVEHRITSHWSRDLVSEHPAGNGRRLKPHRSPNLWPRLLQW